MESFAATPPYYVVVFTSQRTHGDDDAYVAIADRMVELARVQPGFLGIESARGEDGVGITVSYWQSADAIRAWHAEAEHREAQRLGYERWYAWFRLRVCLVERAYEWENLAQSRQGAE